MKKYYENDVERRTSTTSFENMLLFLLSYVSKKEGRNALEEDLAKLYEWAIQIINSSSTTVSTNGSDSNTATGYNNDTKTDQLCRISQDLRSHLAK